MIRFAIRLFAHDIEYVFVEADSYVVGHPMIIFKAGDDPVAAFKTDNVLSITKSDAAGMDAKSSLDLPKQYVAQGGASGVGQ
jgi:hypothetical protein